MAKKKPLNKKVKTTAGTTKQKQASLTRAEQARLRKLFKTKTAESLALAVILLESAGAHGRDYAKIFTASLIADLLKPKRGQSQTETFQTWERLLVAVSAIPAIQQDLMKKIVDIVGKAGYMNLGELSMISDIAATAFVKHKDQLDLRGLASISDTIARSLSRHNGNSLNLSGLLTLSAIAAEALSRYKGNLDLDGLMSISDEVAANLARKRGGTLSLSGLTMLSDAAAKSFAKHDGELTLGGITTLSESAAVALAAHKGRIWLKRLETISDAGADALAANPQIELPFKFTTARAFIASIPAVRKVFLQKHGQSSKPFLDLAAIPSGSFTMGSPPGEAGREPDERRVKVRITQPFLISRTVVTQAQWRDVMGSEPWRHEADGFAESLAAKSCGDHFPAVWITWDLASRFCKTLTDLEREIGRLSSSQEYRLPTEAEWEYACRAGTTTAYSFGDNVRDLREYGWYRDNSSRTLHEVALKKPNAWGLYDMHGNVWEWCSDWYDTATRGGDNPTGPATDPGHDINGFVMGTMPSRVIRGGNRYCKPNRCRSAHRAGWGHEGWRRDILVGFRVVCVTALRQS